MKNANVRITSNIYPAQKKEFPAPLGGWYIPKEGNEAYFQQVSDLQVFRTACDTCACQCSGCFGVRDTTEKPWGRVRINGELRDICKCQHKPCADYDICRLELRENDAKQ